MATNGNAVEAGAAQLCLRAAFLAAVGRYMVVGGGWCQTCCQAWAGGKWGARTATDFDLTRVRGAAFGFEPV